MLHPIRRTHHFAALIGGALLVSTNAFAQTPVDNSSTVPVTPATPAVPTFPAMPVAPVAAPPVGTPPVAAAPAVDTAAPAIPAAVPATKAATPATTAPNPAIGAGLSSAAPAAAPATAASATPATEAPALPTDPNAIIININGRNVASDPAPQLIGGAVYVPLRGVLETLGAQVNYVPAQDRIDIEQQGQTYSLRPGKEGAVAGAKLVPLAPSKVIGGRAFVPLRALAQLFGYEVGWQSQTRTVAISSKNGLALGPTDHRAALAKAGNVGVTVDFSQFPPEELPKLLDQAKAAGVNLIKFRFDWDTLEPTKGAAFNWIAYDQVVKMAREQGFTIVGVLGDTAQWASMSITGDPQTKKLSPPRADAYPAWSNYVTRVVGRYKNDVQAWQVWENPDAGNFYSVSRIYRQIASLAVEAARKSDPKSIVHLAEPGAVSLSFISDLNKNGLTPRIDGVSVYPVAGYQPGTLEAPEAFLRPYAALRTEYALKDGKTRDYWVGGVSFPVVDGGTSDFTERAQADFAVRALALGLAASDGKAFYDVLRDSPERPSGRGLLRADGTPRLAAGGVAALSKAVGNLPFKGAIRADNNAVVLLFDNKVEGAVVAWSPSPRGTKLNLSQLGLPSAAPDSVPVAIRPDSVILDSTGQQITVPDGTLNLTTSPVIITRIGGETAKEVPTQMVSLQLKAPRQFPDTTTGSVTLGQDAKEEGINFRKYARFGGEAQEVYKFKTETGLTTTPPVSALDPASAKPFIYLDVDDDLMYDLPSVPVTVTVEVKRPYAGAQNVLSGASGFRIEYDGNKTTKWLPVEPGEGWATMTFELPDAQFINASGYDMLINSNGSKGPLTFGKITVTKTQPTAIAQNP